MSEHGDAELHRLGKQHMEDDAFWERVNALHPIVKREVFGSPSLFREAIRDWPLEDGEQREFEECVRFAMIAYESENLSGNDNKQYAARRSAVHLIHSFRRVIDLHIQTEAMKRVEQEIAAAGEP